MSRKIIALAAAASLTGLGLAMPAGQAAAAPGVVSAPTVCEPGRAWYRLSSASSSYKVTHVSGVSVAPGSTFEETRTISHERTLTSGVTHSGSAKVSGGTVLANAEAQYGVNLANDKARTNAYSVSRKVTLKSGSTQRRYALFNGRKYWTGRFVKNQCSSDGKRYWQAANGTWRSYMTQQTGSALCPKSRYTSSTLEYKACDAI